MKSALLYSTQAGASERESSERVRDEGIFTTLLLLQSYPSPDIWQAVPKYFNVDRKGDLKKNQNKKDFQKQKQLSVKIKCWF